MVWIAGFALEVKLTEFATPVVERFEPLLGFFLIKMHALCEVADSPFQWRDDSHT